MTHVPRSNSDVGASYTFGRPQARRCYWRLVPVVLFARPLAWLTTIAAAAVLFVGIEAFARRRFLSFVASVLLLAATVVVVVALVRLGHQYWKYVLAVVFGIAALALLIGNVGDLRHGWQRGGEMAADDK